MLYDRVAYDTMVTYNDEKSLLVNLLISPIHEGCHLSKLSSSYVLLVVIHKLIIFTKQKFKFITELLSNIVLQYIYNFKYEVILNNM